MLLAIGCMCVYVALISGVNAAGKVLAEHYHPHQVVFFRHGVAFLLMLALFMPRRSWRVAIPRRPSLQIVRGLFAITSSICYFTALGAVSLANAAAISFTGPLLVTALSGPLLGEQVGVRRWAAVGVGFAGALIIIRPTAAGADHWAALLLVGSATFSALYQIVTRRLAGQELIETTNIWTGLVGGGLMCVLVPFVWITPADIWWWLLFIGTGVVGGLAHYMLTIAFERSPASVLSPFTYLQLLGATITGYAIYGALPDAWTWTGAAVIVAAGLYIAQREARLRRMPRAAAAD